MAFEPLEPHNLAHGETPVCHAETHIKARIFKAVASLRVILVRRAWILPQGRYECRTFFFRDHAEPFLGELHLKRIAVTRFCKTVCCIRMAIGKGRYGLIS